MQNKPQRGRTMSSSMNSEDSPFDDADDDYANFGPQSQNSSDSPVLAALPSHQYHPQSIPTNFSEQSHSHQPIENGHFFGAYSNANVGSGERSPLLNGYGYNTQSRPGSRPSITRSLSLGQKPISTESSPAQMQTHSVVGTVHPLSHRYHKNVRWITRLFTGLSINLLTAGVLLLLYLNYLMFETYYGEFISAFIFNEALWDTKQSFKQWLDSIEASSKTASTKNDNAPARFAVQSSSGVNDRFSMRYSAYSLLCWLFERCSPRSLNPFNSDSSEAYIIAGIFITGFYTKPDWGIMLLTVVAGVLTLAMLLDNHVLILFRGYTWFGITNDTMAAIMVLVLMCGSMVVVTGFFAVMLSRDFQQLNFHLKSLLESGFEQDGWANEWTQDLVVNYMPEMRKNLVSFMAHMEAEMKTNGFGKFAKLSLDLFDSVNATLFSHSATSGLAAADPDECALSEEPLSQSLWQFSMGAFDLNQLDFNTIPVDAIKDQILKIDKEAVMNVGPKIIQSLFAGLWQTQTFVAAVAGFSVFLLDMGLRFIFFVTLLFLFLSSKETLLQSLLANPKPDYSGNATSNSIHRANSSESAENGEIYEETDEFSLVLLFEEELRKGMETVLLMPVKLSLLNSFATLLVCNLFDLDYRFLCTTLIFLFTLFPLITAYWMLIPWLVVYVTIFNWSYAYTSLIFAVHWGAHFLVASWVLNGMNARRRSSKRRRRNASGSNWSFLWGERMRSYESVGTDSDCDDRYSAQVQQPMTSSSDESIYSGKREYITSLSLFFGVVTFGGKGVVIGPFLFVLVTIMHQVYLAYSTMIQNEDRFLEIQQSQESQSEILSNANQEISFSLPPDANALTTTSDLQNLESNERSELGVDFIIHEPAISTKNNQYQVDSNKTRGVRRAASENALNPILVKNRPEMIAEKLFKVYHKSSDGAAAASRKKQRVQPQHNVEASMVKGSSLVNFHSKSDIHTEPLSPAQGDRRSISSIEEPAILLAAESELQTFKLKKSLEHCRAMKSEGLLTDHEFQEARAAAIEKFKI